MNDTGLWNGRPGNVLFPFCETTCSRFSAFWRPENTIYAELWTPLANNFNSSSKFKGHAKRPTKWPGWKVKGQGQTRTTQASFEMGVLETSFCRFVKRPVAIFLYFGGLKIRFMPSHEPPCPKVLIQGQSSKDIMKKPNSWPGRKVKGQGQTRTTQAFETGALETYASWNNLKPVFCILAAWKYDLCRVMNPTVQ